MFFMSMSFEQGFCKYFDKGIFSIKKVDSPFIPCKTILLLLLIIIIIIIIIITTVSWNSRVWKSEETNYRTGKKYLENQLHKKHTHTQHFKGHQNIGFMRNLTITLYLDHWVQTSHKIFIYPKVCFSFASNDMLETSPETKVIIVL